MSERLNRRRDLVGPSISEARNGVKAMENQLARGQKRRVMYIENKDGDIDGVAARIGWVRFSKSGQSLFYRERELRKAGRAIGGNFVDVETGEVFWVSGIKKLGSNVHWAEPVRVEIDADARDEYRAIRGRRAPSN